MPRRRRLNLWPILVLLGIVAVLGAAGYGGYYWYEAPDRATDRCASPFVGDLVGQAFDQSNLAQLEHVRSFAILSIQQQSFDRAARLRTCTAVLEASDHSHVRIRYTVHPFPPDQASVSLTILGSADIDNAR